MQPKVYQPAGEAQEEKFASAVNPIGLYQNKYNGTLVGVLDPIQGDAVIRNGFELVEEGREAAMLPQDELDKRQKAWVKKNDPAAKDQEISDLQRQLDEANAQLAARAESDQANIEHIRATADQSDTAADQAALVPERNIKAPLESPGQPEAPKGADLKAAQSAKEEATQPVHTAEQDLKAAGALDDDGKQAKRDEEAEAAPRGVNENATLKSSDNAKEQLSDIIPGADPEPKGAEKDATPNPANPDVGGKAEKTAKANAKKDEEKK